MSLWGNITNFLGFGNSNQKKKPQPKPQQNSWRPPVAPGVIIRPQQQQQNNQQRTNANKPQTVKVVQRAPQQQAAPLPPPDNSISLAPLQKTKPKAAPTAGNFDPNAPIVKANPKPAPTMSNVEIAARSAGSVGANIAGGTLGAVKGLIELPSAILTAPKLVKSVAAKVTHNDKAAKNAAESNGLLDRAAQNYESFVKPVAEPLRKAEVATDRAATNVAPWQPRVAKDITKVATNLVPVDAAANAVTKLSKARKAGQVVEAGTDATRVAATAAKTQEVSPGVHSVNPNRTADVLKQGQADHAALPPAPMADPQIRTQMLAEDPVASSIRKAPAGPSRVQPGDYGFAYRKPAVGQADDAARLEAERQAQIADPTNEEPTFLRRIKDDPTRGDEALRTNASTIAKSPEFADAIQHSYQVTGAKDPLSLVMHTLANTPSKPVVRDIVEQLLPDAHPNVLNRAVNMITGAHDPTDVAEALTEATKATAAPEMPFGAVSDAPAAVPAPVADAPVMAGPGAASVAPPPVKAPPVAPAQVANDAISSVPAQLEGTPQVAPTPAVVSEVAPTTPPVAPAEHGLPAMPETAPAPQVPVAPNTHDALVKQMGPEGPAKKGKYSTRDKVNLDELRSKAEGVVANMSDEEVLNAFQTVGPDTMVTDANSFAIARAALDRLGSASGEVAAQTVSNIMDAMERYVSKAGTAMRIVQESFDNLPLPMKVRYLAKKIDAANRDVKGYEPLAHDPAKLAEVEAALTNRLQSSQAVSEQIASLTGKLNDAADAARKGEKVDIKDVVKQIHAKQVELQAKNGEVAKYFQSLVPGRNRAQRALVDFPKRMMLSSFTGRINDILTTGANVADLQINNVVQGVVGGVTNLVKGKGTVTNTFKGMGKLTKSIVPALKKLGGESGGTQYVDNIQQSLKGQVELRSGLRSPGGRVGRTIQAATEFATNLSAGVRDQRLYQLADQEAAQLGLKGAFRKQYAEARAAAPSHQMVDAATTLHKEVNNLNDNPISRTLNNVAQAIEGDNRFGRTGIGGLIKNQIMPFTSWLGGNIWNSITDRNVIANFVKFTSDAARGNTEGAIRNLSRTLTGAAEGYAIGYQLAAHGMLTDKNAEGYNDGGMYVHIGDRYIPVGMFGLVAPNVVLGKMVHDGMHSDNPVGTMAADLGNFAWHGLALGQALGVENTVTRAYNEANKPGHDAADGAAVAAGGVAGQYVPALGGDVNAIINNSPFNPTHEAADTRVQVDRLTKSGKPSTAKDIPKSSIASLQNRVPVLSQKLPRKKDVAAPDLLDRTTRGDRGTPGQSAALVKAKQEADNMKRPGSPAVIKAANDKDRADFVKMNVEKAVINGKTYINKDGNVHAYTADEYKKKLEDDKKQQLTDDFKKSNKDFMEKDGMVYQKGSNGKVTVMEKKDYDYKTADDGIQTAKKNGDVSGHQTSSSNLLDNISWQLNHAKLTQEQRTNLVQKALQVQEDYAKVEQYGGFTKPRHADSYESPQITGGKPEYVKSIQEHGVKYGLDVNALMAVAAQEGLGGGVGDGGHAFGPFQMNDAVGVLKGKFKSSQEARAYAESAAGIEDAISQIAKVAKGKTGKAAIEAIVREFERPADPDGEVARALALYSGGKAVVSDNGGSAGGVSSFVPSDAEQARIEKAAKEGLSRIQANKINPTDLKNFDFGDLKIEKAGSQQIPTIQQIKAGDLIKKRTIKVGKA
jgi:hypothetical protein